ncbi:hypothetical protein [Metabacillus fastidiosus]|uniref:hypothetical protein n=1 Tax=Metabacillus fastidiosus TaxID=1458 RepID=UPI003D2DA12A
MCKLCNGKYVIHEETAATAMFIPCPNCTPISKDEAELRSQKLKARLDKAFAELERANAS